MFYGTKIPKAIFAATLLCLATSCAGFKLPPPGPDKQALLVLPAEFSNPTHNKTYGFYYFYEIVSDPDDEVTIDSLVIPYKAIFKLPIKEGILIVDSLPPGNYIIRNLVIQHYGTGTSSTHRRGWSRNDMFKLESGKITIFPKSLNISLSYKDPGRIENITYRHRVVSVTFSQRREILGTLEKLSNFEKWEVLGP